MTNNMIVKEYVFRKRDGSIRILKGTREFTKFKTEKPKIWEVIKPSTDKHNSRSVITLIDIEINKWRSIKPETIISERTVGSFAPKFKFSDNDGWIRKSEKANFIKRDKVPYHVLMLMNRVPLIKKNDVEKWVKDENIDALVAAGMENTRRTKLLEVFPHTVLENQCYRP